MKLRSALILILVITITVACGYGTYYGYSLNGEKIIPGASQMRMGLDIAGGVRLVYKISGENITEDALQRTETVLRNRLDTKGLTEATVTIDDTNPLNSMIVVEIPGFSDPEEASAFLGQTAKLQFIEPDGTVVMEGDDLVDARAEYGPTSSNNAGITKNEHYVSLTLSNEAVSKFAEATERLSQTSNNFIEIVLDGNSISKPGVNERIESSTCIISGPDFTSESAGNLADLIKSGSLPYTLISENQEYIGPTIGHQAFTVTLYAGAVAIIFVIIFLIFVYKLSGLISVLSLTIYSILLILIHQWADITITLPGIAGIILSIAMAVDSSVIIYERLREELRAGKTLKTSIDLAFGKSFSTIRDSNITTIISALVLLVFGTGPVKGFAIALLIGIILSLLISLVVLRYLLKWISNLVSGKKPWIYGA